MKSNIFKVYIIEKERERMIEKEKESLDPLALNPSFLSSGFYITL